MGDQVAERADGTCENLISLTIVGISSHKSIKSGSFRELSQLGYDSGETRGNICH